MKGTKEFYDLQAQFEKDINGMPLYVGVERDKLNGDHDVWGYQFSKTIHRE